MRLVHTVRLIWLLCAVGTVAGCPNESDKSDDDDDGGGDGASSGDTGAVEDDCPDGEFLSYLDEDGDGYGNPEESVVRCFLPEGYADNGDDCDDDNEGANPEADEIWYDGVDQACDEGSDYDQDGDGFDSDEYGGTDCDDLNATVSPDAEDTWYDGVNQDCDGAGDYDQDGDGHDALEHGGADCDDLDAETHPDVADYPEGGGSTCDGLDRDCDETVETVVSATDDLQDAIDAAAADTALCLAAGTYLGNFDYGGKDIAIVGTDGADATVLSGGGSGRVVSFSGGEGLGAVLERVTVREGYGDGGGVFVANAAPYIRNVKIVRNQSYDNDYYSAAKASGLYAVSSQPRLENVILAGQSTRSFGYYQVRALGGGVYLEQSVLQATNVVMMSNSAYAMENNPDRGAYGGAIFAGSNSSVYLTNSILSENTAENGAAIKIDGASAVVSYCDIHNNHGEPFEGMTTPVGADGNVDVYPFFNDWSSSEPADWDLSLQTSSPLVDAGSPSISDPDGSASDIGAYGGPLGGNW